MLWCMTAFMYPTLAITALYRVIHDHPRPYPRSRATLSTITRNPIHDHPQPYPRSRATMPMITHDHATFCHFVQQSQIIVQQSQI